MSTLEQRDIEISGLEVRDGDEPVVTGYAAVFNSWSNDLGGFREQIQAGAFTRTIEGEEKVFAFWQHNPADPIGHTANGKLRLQEDARGLRFEIPARAFTERQLELVRDGTVSHMSFGFLTREDRWNGTERTLIDVDLREVSPVTLPAYTDTTVAVRALEASRPVPTSWPNVLRRRDDVA